MSIDTDYHMRTEMNNQLDAETLDPSSLYSYGPWEFGSDITWEIDQAIRGFQRTCEAIFTSIKSLATV